MQSRCERNWFHGNLERGRELSWTRGQTNGVFIIKEKEMLTEGEAGDKWKKQM
jgi:hypothetical protein